MNLKIQDGTDQTSARAQFYNNFYKMEIHKQLSTFLFDKSCKLPRRSVGLVRSLYRLFMQTTELHLRSKRESIRYKENLTSDPDYLKRALFSAVRAGLEAVSLEHAPDRLWWRRITAEGYRRTAVMFNLIEYWMWSMQKDEVDIITEDESFGFPEWFAKEFVLFFTLSGIVLGGDPFGPRKAESGLDRPRCNEVTSYVFWQELDVRIPTTYWR